MKYMLFTKLRQLKKSARYIHLNAAEKKLMESTVLEFIKANPVRMQSESRQILHLTERFSVFSFLHRKYMFATMAAVLVVMLTGGVSYAAEGSYPGQPLYPVKHINEEVKAALTVTTEAHADWEARRVERRLEEATTLAAQGKLSEKAETELSQTLKAQVHATENQIKKLETAGQVQVAAQVSARLSNALAVHGNLISSLKPEVKVTAEVTVDKIPHYENSNTSNTEPNRNSVGHVQNSNVKTSLVHEIKLQADAVTQVKVNLDKKETTNAETNTKVTVNTAASAKIGAAKNKIAEVKKFIASKKLSAKPETVAKAEARLKVAESEVVKAESSLQAKAYSDAFAHATRAHEIAQEAKLLVVIQTNVKVELNVGKILNQVEGKEKEVNSEKKIRVTSTTLHVSSTTPKIVPVLKNSVELKIRTSTSSTNTRSMKLTLPPKITTTTKITPPPVKLNLQIQNKTTGTLKLVR